MAQVITASFGQIALACKNHLAAQIPIITANPDLVIIVGRDAREVPHFTGERDVILRPGSFAAIDRAFDGAGRTCSKLTRYLEVMPRDRLLTDASDRDQYRLTNPLPPGQSLDPNGAITGTPSDSHVASYGHFPWEETILSCLHGFWPKDGSLNLLTDCEIRLATGEGPIKGEDRDTPDWMRSAFRMEVEYLTTLNQTYWDPPLITTPDTLSAFRGASFSQTITAVGGKPPYTWSMIGSLPPGLSFSNGLISGTVSTLESATGIWKFTIIVTDANGQRGTMEYHMPIISILPTTLPHPRVGVHYSQAMTLQGPHGTVIWTATGLPPGLSIGQLSGVISGTVTNPGVGGPYFVEISVPGKGHANYEMIVDP